MAPRAHGFTLVETLVALGLVLVVLAFAMRLVMVAIDEHAAATAEAVLQSDADLALGHIIRDVRQAEEVRCGADELLLCLTTGEHLRYAVDPRDGALVREMLNADHRGRSRITRHRIKVKSAAFEQHETLVTVTLELETMHRRSGQPVTLTVSSAAAPRN